MFQSPISVSSADSTPHNKTASSISSISELDDFPDIPDSELEAMVRTFFAQWLRS